MKLTTETTGFMTQGISTYFMHNTCWWIIQCRKMGFENPPTLQAVVICPTKPHFAQDIFFSPSIVTHCTCFHSRLYSVIVLLISLKMSFPVVVLSMLWTDADSWFTLNSLSTPWMNTKSWEVSHTSVDWFKAREYQQKLFVFSFICWIMLPPKSNKQQYLTQDLSFWRGLLFLDIPLLLLPLYTLLWYYHQWKVFLF